MAELAVSHVAGVGGPRSASTRQAILAAARAEFSARGFHGATIRGIASNASIDPSMVMRYFGSKAALFATATKVVLDPVDLTGMSPRRRGQTIVRHLVERWEDRSSVDSIALLRTAVADEGVATALQQVFDQDIRSPIAALGGDRLPERTAAVGAALLGLAVTRYILRFDPIVSLPPDQVIETFGRMVQPLLT